MKPGYLVQDSRGFIYFVMAYPEGHLDHGEPVAVRPMRPFAPGTETFGMAALETAHGPLTVLHPPPGITEPSGKGSL